jgi:hypothetical protein
MPALHYKDGVIHYDHFYVNAMDRQAIILCGNESCHLSYKPSSYHIGNGLISEQRKHSDCC